MKKILVTGANRGIGFETVRQLLDRGHEVILSGRSSDKVKKAVKSLEGFKDRVQPLIMDVSDRASIEKASKRCKDEFGSIDVLINNAGVLLSKDSALSKDDMEVFEKTFEVNVEGPLLVSRAFLPLLNRPSRIINISSGGGSMSEDVGGWAPAYCSSKTALNGITRQLAHELRSDSISVNAICPGWVRSDMGGSSAPRPLSKGAETPVWLAIEADASFTGKFFRDKKVIPW